MDLYDELAWRGMVYDTTEGLREVIARESLTAYIGFDPTAASLHVGSLLPVMALARLQRFGHSPIALVGGGTGLIGDPSGKAAERSLLTPEHVDANVRGIRSQLERFLDFDRSSHAARLVNNLDWLGELSALEFMRDVGKYFTVNYMLAKESVKRRVESEDGISYTEFSYLLLQSYDFFVLHERFGCTLQMGGSDQWGNITAGLDLIRKLRGARAHGMVLPLVTSAAGTKFGKTEAGTVWLDPALTTPYEFYQFWFNADDRDAARYLKFFTFLDSAAVAALEAASSKEPEKRHAQRELAREVTRLVHGAAAVQEAEAAADKLFRGDISAMSVAELLQIFPNVPSCDLAPVSAGWLVPELLTAAGVAASKSEAVRLVKGGGISLNGRRIADEKERITRAHAIEGRIFVIRKGKKDNYLVRLVGAGG
jgi:tyrosyl-tRNA synthetase